VWVVCEALSPIRQNDVGDLPPSVHDFPVICRLAPRTRSSTVRLGTCATTGTLDPPYCFLLLNRTVSMDRTNKSISFWVRAANWNVISQLRTWPVIVVSKIACGPVAVAGDFAVNYGRTLRLRQANSSPASQQAEEYYESAFHSAGRRISPSSRILRQLNRYHSSDNGPNLSPGKGKAWPAEDQVARLRVESDMKDGHIEAGEKKDDKGSSCQEWSVTRFTERNQLGSYVTCLGADNLPRYLRSANENFNIYFEWMFR